MVQPILLNGTTLLVDLKKDHIGISTAGCTRGFSEIRYIVFKTVPKDFNVVDLDTYCENLATSMGVDYTKTTIFLTAVDVTTYTHGKAVFGDIEAEALVTFGVNKISCMDSTSHSGVNTINVAVIVNKPLSYVGLLDLFRIVSEVKGMTMTLGGPTCTFGASVGTASDATAVVALKGNERFAGIATDVGIAASYATLNALIKQLKKTTGVVYLAKTLGFNDIDEIIDLAITVYEKAEIPCIDKKQIEIEIRNEIQKLVDDPNVVMFIRGLRLLEAALALGLIPVVDLSEYKSDSPGIIVDELAGKAIAEYINGFKGLLSYYWVERLKVRENVKGLNTLPPITDDLVEALIGGVLSRIYDRYSRYCPTRSLD